MTGLCDPIAQDVMQSLKHSREANATDPVSGLRCLLITVVSGGRGSPTLFSETGQGWVGSPSYVDGESIVERILTTSARWVGEMCWVMWTMESMATSGLAWTKLRICLRT